MRKKRRFARSPPNVRDVESREVSQEASWKMKDRQNDRKRHRRKLSLGVRKLSRDQFVTFPQEIVAAFARLPKVFRKQDVDRHLDAKISRSMKWRYLRRMEASGLTKRVSKKYYTKLYTSFSEYIEKEVIPRIRGIELRSELGLGIGQD